MAITVKESKAGTAFVIKDALGKMREGFAVMDGNQVCGIEKTRESADKRADAIRFMRRASR